MRLKLEQSQVILITNELPQEILVFVDKGQIQQALLNLVLNALGAMPNGGELSIQSSVNSLNRAEILVRDTGNGIPEDLREQIFDSFLTARTDGTGLGLTISKRILRSHDGDLELLESEKMEPYLNLLYQFQKIRLKNLNFVVKFPFIKSTA